MASKLTEFVRTVAAEPFAWGQWDCALILGKWWECNHGVNPASYLVGSYSTEEECGRILVNRGGLPRLVSELAQSVGASRGNGNAGDFGVIRHDGKWYGAIKGNNGRWIVKSTNGVVELLNPKIVKSWAV
jgi:hypothetical protein